MLWPLAQCMYSCCVNSGMGVGDSCVAVFSPIPHISSCFLSIHHTQSPCNTPPNRHIYQRLRGWQHTHKETHIAAARPTVSGTTGACTHIHTHAHTAPLHTPPSQIVLGWDRVVCDELYVSSRLLKVNFLKTAAHWRGEEMIWDWSMCVCQYHSAGSLWTL